MPATLRTSRFNGPQQQRGAIGLMAAGTLALVLLFMLLVVDSGRLYFEQRKLQRVADMAALETATLYGSCASGTAQTYALASAGRNGFVPNADQTLGTTCGWLETGPGPNYLRTFKVDANKAEAIRVIATTIAPTSVAGALWNAFSKGKFAFRTQLTASAVGATAGTPLAQLTIRTALVNINEKQSALLNPLIGGMLGGSLNLSAASWNGLIDTKITLLDYLDTLLSLNTNVGNYNELLNTELKLSQLLNVLKIKVLEKNGPGARVVADQLAKIIALPGSAQLLKLGNLLKIKNGTPSAGLNTDISLFDILQGVAQLSNGKNAAAVTINTNVPLVGNIVIKTKVIEPPQLSAIGNPALAIKRPLVAADQILVKTAQVQTHIHVDIAILKLVSEISTALTTILSPVINLVNNLLDLNLVSALENILVGNKTSLSIASAFDIYLEAASANSYVTDYSCSSNETKTLSVSASSSLANLSIGSPPLNATFPPTVKVGDKNLLAIEPVKLINVDVKKCLASLICLDKKIGEGGGLGLKIQSQFAANSQELIYRSSDSPDSQKLKNVGQAPTYKSISSTDIIGSLSKTLNKDLLVTYIPKTDNVTNDALAGVADLINSVANTLISTLTTLLAPLLDPVINTLLKALGVNLAVAEVGANLSCSQGGRAQLVL